MIRILGLAVYGLSVLVGRKLFIGFYDFEPTLTIYLLVVATAGIAAGACWLVGTDSN